MKAIMKRTVKLLGTDLEIKERRKVNLVPSTNLPDQNKYFARPARRTGIWKFANAEDSILVEKEDFEFIKLVFVDDFVDFNDPVTQAMTALFDRDKEKSEKLLTYQVIDCDGFLISTFCAKSLKEAKAVVKKEYPKKKYCAVKVD